MLETEAPLICPFKRKLHHVPRFVSLARNICALLQHGALLGQDADTQPEPCNGRSVLAGDGHPPLLDVTITSNNQRGRLGPWNVEFVGMEAKSIISRLLVNQLRYTF